VLVHGAFADGLAAARRVLNRQDGPTILVGHSYGRTVITEAGICGHEDAPPDALLAPAAEAVDGAVSAA
jgi:predicted alpha/beta hydrolase family esterase